jgi:predicted esterase
MRNLIEHDEKMKIIKEYLNYSGQKTHIFYFIPEEITSIRNIAIFTHGYTADKSSILSWGLKLCEVGIPVAIFDIPGHYLGNFSEVLDFEHFKMHAHELFLDAYLRLKEILDEKKINFDEDFLTILGGHSLGAMLALKSLGLDTFKNIKTLGIGVGIGLAPKNNLHLFDTPFYKATLLIREELVSKALCSKNVFHWIKDEKENLDCYNQEILLITGEDDVVVGNDGMERFKAVLEANNNHVSMVKPNSLPHHTPDRAAAYIKQALKSKGRL